MKRNFILIILTVLSLALNAGMWETITNTSHIYDLDYPSVTATWGGAVVDIAINGGTTTMNKTWTTGEGIVSNDIRVVERIDWQSYWLGSSNNGISIISEMGVQNLDLSLGLPSLQIREIKKIGDRILVATSNGLAEYYYLSGVSFPLLLHSYRMENTGNGLVSNNIESMAYGENGYLYLGTPSGISYVHADSLALDAAWHSWTGINSLLQIGFSNRVTLNSTELLVVNGTRVLKRSLDPLLSDWQVINTGLPTDISAFHLDAAGNIWLAWGIWDEDLVRFTTPGDVLFSKIEPDGTRTDLAKLEAGLGTKTVTYFYTENNLLVLGTWGDGAYTRIDNNDFIQHITNSIGFPKISDIDVDQDNSMWFASGYIDAEPVKKGSLGVSYYEDETWHTLNISNSPLHNDSVHSLVVDSGNRIWFGAWDVIDNVSPEGWQNAITIYDKPNDRWKRINSSGMRNWDPDTQDWGPLLPGAANLVSNTIGGVDVDRHGNVFVAGYDRGFSVIAPDDSLLGSFTIQNSNSQRVLNMYHSGRQYFFGTYNDNGLVIWNDDSIPVTGGDKWLTPPPTDLANCQVYGVTSTNSSYNGWQHWIAASNGFYMWDESNWYKYDTSVKRFIYNTATHLWTNDQLYYVDEERLFGSVRTVPASLYQDPFGRVWIGSLENGITMYDPDTDRFTNYFLPKDPLLSNYITALGYEPTSGKLWIGTPDGLNTLLIGKFIKPITPLETVKAFPNPFKPDVHGLVQIVNLPENSMPRGRNQCRVYDSSGALIAKLEENEFARFVWDGSNAAGKKASSGVYFYVVSDEKGNVRRGKIALIR